jgi:hypothetical protein
MITIKELFGQRSPDMEGTLYYHTDGRITTVMLNYGNYTMNIRFPAKSNLKEGVKADIDAKIDRSLRAKSEKSTFIITSDFQGMRPRQTLIVDSGKFKGKYEFRMGGSMAAIKQQIFIKKIM